MTSAFAVTARFGAVNAELLSARTVKKWKSLIAQNAKVLASLATNQTHAKSRLPMTQPQDERREEEAVKYAKDFWDKRNIYADFYPSDFSEAVKYGWDRRGEVDASKIAQLEHELADERSGDCDLMKTNRRLESNAKIQEARIAELEEALKNLSEAAKRVLDAESNFNEEEQDKAGCLPGYRLISGRFEINACMYEMSHVIDCADKALGGKEA